MDVASWEEFKEVAFVAYASMPATDLDRFGAMLDEFGFTRITNEELIYADHNTIQAASFVRPEETSQNTVGES